MLPNPDEIDLSHFKLYKVVGKGGFGKVNAVVMRDPVTGKADAASEQFYALKRQEKSRILAKDFFLELVWTERNIMAQLTSPYLCNILYAFQSPVEVFFVMPFMSGGSLQYHLSNSYAAGMPENMVKFFAVELLLGLEELHSLNIVYRDMKPDNALLDSEGHLRLADFGVSAILRKDTSPPYTESARAGTFGYMAPEMLLGVSRYGTSVDVWSYGITLYTLLHGYMPWSSCGMFMSDGVSSALNASMGVHENEVDKVMRNFTYSKALSGHATSFLQALLQVDVRQRLGVDGLKSDWEKVKKHPFFDGVDWAKAQVKDPSLKSPLKIKTGVANCTNDAMLEDQIMDSRPMPIPDSQQYKFQGFEFNVKALKTIRKAGSVGSDLAGKATGAAAATPPAAKKRASASNSNHVGEGKSDDDDSEEEATSGVDVKVKGTGPKTQDAQAALVAFASEKAKEGAGK